MKIRQGMKIRASYLLWTALAVAVLVWIVGQFGSGDGRLIRKRLSEIERLMDKPDGESQLIGANKVRQLGNLLMPEFVINVVPYSQTVTDRQALLQVAMGYRGRSRTAGVDFSDIELEVDTATRTARLTTIAVVSGEGLSRESYRVAMEWSKSGNDWLIRQIDVLEVLEGAPLF